MAYIHTTECGRGAGAMIREITLRPFPLCRELKLHHSGSFVSTPLTVAAINRPPPPRPAGPPPALRSPRDAPRHKLREFIAASAKQSVAGRASEKAQVSGPPPPLSNAPFNPSVHCQHVVHQIRKPSNLSKTCKILALRFSAILSRTNCFFSGTRFMLEKNSMKNVRIPEKLHSLKNSRH